VPWHSSPTTLPHPLAEHRRIVSEIL